MAVHGPRDGRGKGSGVLIPVSTLVADYGLTDVSGVLHLGAHFGEEADAYDHDMPWTAEPRVVWVEGDPQHLDQLSAHVVDRTGHQIVSGTLVDSTAGEAVLHIASNQGASSSVLAFGTHAVEHPHITYVAEQTLPVETVDHLAGLHGWDDLNFLTLDLQGLELRALRGALQFLEHVDYVFSEVNQKPLYVGCPMIEEIDAFLAGFDRVATEWTGWGWGDAFWVRR